jgi:RNA polymerase-interacting CarD/CdnL/TRCF family regulator
MKADGQVPPQRIEPMPKLFEIDDWVVHPQHGLGRVVKLEKRRFGSKPAQLYYEISIPNGTVWIKAKGSKSEIRKVIEKSDLAHFRTVLKSRPNPLPEDFRHRQTELAYRLKKGTFKAKCEFVRDLSALSWQKHLGDSNAKMLRVAHQALNEEWAMADGVSIGEASSEVQSLLMEGKALYGV